MQVNWSLEKKIWGPMGLQNDFKSTQVGLVIGVSIDIFLAFLVFFYNIVIWLNVSEFNQMYEILG